MAAVVGNKPFTINEWRVEPSLNRLSRADEVVKIDPQNMKVLELLASRPGDVISQREIEETAWAGVIVTSNSVYQSIAQLRRALGDDKSNPRYIETIARKGYRLIAPVSELRDLVPELQHGAPATHVPDDSDNGTQDKPFLRRAGIFQQIVLALVASLLAAVTGLQLYKLNNSAQAATEPNASDLRIGSDLLEKETVGRRVERLISLASGAMDQGHPQQAIAYYEHALALQRNATGDLDPYVVEILSGLATLHNWNDDLAQAEALAREALHLAEQLGSELSPNVIFSHAGLGDVLLNMGRFSEAEYHTRRAIELSRVVFGERDTKTASARYALAVLRIHQHRGLEAEAIVNDALKVLTAKHGPQEAATAHARSVLAMALFQQHRYEDGAAEAREAIQILQLNARPQHPFLGTALQILGDCLNALGEYEEAERASRAAMKIWKENDAKPWRVARAASSLGEALLGQGRTVEAEQHLSYATRIFEHEGSALQELAADLHRQRLARFESANVQSQLTLDRRETL